MELPFFRSLRGQQFGQEEGFFRQRRAGFAAEIVQIVAAADRYAAFGFVAAAVQRADDEKQPSGQCLRPLPLQVGQPRQYSAAEGGI